MKIKNRIMLVLIFLVVIIAGYYFLFSKLDLAGNTVADNAFGWKFPITKFPLVGPTTNEIGYSVIRSSGGIPEGLPVRLKIPVIGVDSKIEDALITPDGRMDVPSGSVNVAWFALGPHPGEVGSAVIGGHFGIRNGVKFVFYDLDKLVVGDKVYIENDKGETLAFQVRSIKLFDRNADATTVFTSNDGLAHLNLITCEGIWNKVNGSYPQRRVVFTDAIAGEGVAPIGVIFHSTLRIGVRGADVVILQKALQEKGFLKISSSMADGIFGPITRIAVAQYQASVGLKSDGVFGPLTRTKFTSKLEIAVLNSKLPLAGVSIPPSSLFSAQILVQYVKSLYRTPLDGIVTSLLLGLIIFLIFRIIKLF